MLSGFSHGLSVHGDCTGRWRLSCWSLWFRWFGILRLEIEYQIDGPIGVTTYRKARTDEWQVIIISQQHPTSTEAKT